MKTGQSSNNVNAPNRISHHQLPQQTQTNQNFENRNYTTATGNHQPPPYPMYYNQQNTLNAPQMPYNNNFNGIETNNQYPMNENVCNNQMIPTNNGIYNVNMNYSNTPINTNGIVSLKLNVIFFLFSQI